MIGNLHRTGCMFCSVRKLRQTGYKTYQVHRFHFVWECYNGLILDGKVIDHVPGYHTERNIERNLIER